MDKDDFNATARKLSPTSHDVLHAIQQVLARGYKIDDDAFAVQNQVARQLHSALSSHENQPSALASFLFSNGAERIEIVWDTAKETAWVDMRLDDGAAGKTWKYSVVDFNEKKPLSECSLFERALAETLPKQWQKSFLAFAKKGDLPPDLHEYLETDPHAQKVVEMLVYRDLEALRAFGQSLRKENGPSNG